MDGQKVLNMTIIDTCEIKVYLFWNQRLTTNEPEYFIFFLNRTRACKAQTPNKYNKL